MGSVFGITNLAAMSAVIAQNVRTDINVHNDSPQTSCRALIIRVGFGAHYSITIIWNPQNSPVNYLGPYIRETREDHLG